MNYEQAFPRCKKCDELVEDDWSYCPFCGRKISWNSEAGEKKGRDV
jgi:RNA polymerase subunit RPABC4/transcription elongation factor Spt4